MCTTETAGVREAIAAALAMKVRVVALRMNQSFCWCHIAFPCNAYMCSFLIPLSPFFSCLSSLSLFLSL